jgi:hypothetical protein
MKLRAFAGIICCTALLALPPAADAGTPIPATLTIDDSTVVGPLFEFVGHLTTPNRKCLGGRTVKLFNEFGSSRTLIDTDVTSSNGVFAGSGDPTGATGLQMTVTRKSFGPRKHRRTCASATFSVA